MIARLGGNDQFIAVGLQNQVKYASEILFSRSGRRAIIVGQVKMGDARIEGHLHDLTTILQHIHMPEIVPQAQGDGRQLQTTLATAAVLHGLVTRSSRRIAHKGSKLGR